MDAHFNSSGVKPIEDDEEWRAYFEFINDLKKVPSKRNRALALDNKAKSASGKAPRRSSMAERLNRLDNIGNASTPASRSSKRITSKSKAKMYNDSEESDEAFDDEEDEVMPSKSRNTTRPINKNQSDMEDAPKTRKPRNAAAQAKKMVSQSSEPEIADSDAASTSKQASVSLEVPDISELDEQEMELGIMTPPTPKRKLDDIEFESSPELGPSKRR